VRLSRSNLVPLLLALLLVIVLVRTIPFTPRLSLDLAAGAQAEGNVVRQALFIALLAALALPLAFADPRTLLRSVSLPFVLLAGFALLSLLWSPVTALAGRRLGLTLVVALSLFAATSQMRPLDSLRTLRAVLFALVLASLAAGLFVPEAIHQPGDPETSVIGAWRGVFYHKNHAGAATGLALVLAVDLFVRERRRLAGAAWIAIAIAFLVLTRSKTAQAASLLAIIVMLGFRGVDMLAGGDRARGVLLRLALVAAIVAAVAFVWFTADIAAKLADPEAFTGRGIIWHHVLALIAERPLIGHGYESVFQAGDASPLVQRAGLTGIGAVPHGHNGVLDLLVALGLVGALLYAWCFLVDPLRRFLALPSTLRRQWLPLVAAMICFALVESLMEGRMFSGETLVFILFAWLLGVSLCLERIVEAPLSAGSGPATGRAAR